MPKRTTINPFLSFEQIQARFEAATDPIEQSQWQLIRFLSQTQNVASVAQTTGCSPGGIREVARRYNGTGSAALGDKRHIAKGAKPLLSPAQLAELENLLATSSSDQHGRPWNGPVVTE